MQPGVEINLETPTRLWKDESARLSNLVPSTNIYDVNCVYSVSAQIVLHNACTCSGCRKDSCWHMRNETEQHILQMYLFILLRGRVALHILDGYSREVCPLPCPALPCPALHSTPLPSPPLHSLPSACLLLCISMHTVCEVGELN